MASAKEPRFDVDVVSFLIAAGVALAIFLAFELLIGPWRIWR